MDYLDFAGAEDYGGYFDFGGVGMDYGLEDFASTTFDSSSFDGALDSLDASSLPSSFDSAVDSITSTATDLFGDFDLSKFVTGLAQTYVQYDLGRRQIEAQTQRPAPPQTRPTSGATRQLPDGSIARTNADGSTTVTSPTGRVRTVTPTGQIVQGAGGSLIPGVSNTLLIGGAIGLGALLLLARRE